MTKSNPQLQVQLRRDLFAAYRDVTSRPCPSQAIAWHRTVRHKAPRFYVSTKRATNALYKIARGDFSELQKMPKLKQQMYTELYGVVLELYQKSEFVGKPLRYVISFAIARPASQFFVTTERVRFYFRNAKRYGIDFTAKEARALNQQYTNRKDGKPSTAVFTGKKHLLINL